MHSAVCIKKYMTRNFLSVARNAQPRAQATYLAKNKRITNEINSTPHLAYALHQTINYIPSNLHSPPEISEPLCLPYAQFWCVYAQRYDGVTVQRVVTPT